MRPAPAAADTNASVVSMQESRARMEREQILPVGLRRALGWGLAGADLDAAFGG